jgi:hypothetical protein
MATRSGTPTFGIFDHIEEIPGTPTRQLLRDRLDLVRIVDQAGFEAFYLAEHLLIAIDDPAIALDMAQRGMHWCGAPTTSTDGTPRCWAPTVPRRALGPLRKILAHIDVAVAAGAGTASQLTDRIGALLEEGLTDFVVLQLPVGDQTYAEARRTLDAFCSEVKPAPESR